MYSIRYVEPEARRQDRFSVNVVLSAASEKRNFFGIRRMPGELYCYQFHKKASRTDYHVSRHRSGVVHRKLKGQAPFYPIKDGQLGTARPMDFKIKIREPQKLPIQNVQGVETVRLFEMAEGFFGAELLFQRSVAEGDRADHEFVVELDRFVGRVMSFRVFLTEPHQKAPLNAYLDELQRLRVESVAEITLSRVEVFAGATPWVGVALLTGRRELMSL